MKAVQMSHNLPGAFSQVVSFTTEPVGTRAIIADKSARTPGINDGKDACR